MKRLVCLAIILVLESLDLVFAVGFPSSLTTLKCWQCAVTKGYPSVCPDDAVLYELTGWDACMTWRLSDGTVVLQNFVRKAEDCTPKRLGYWEDYIKFVWKDKGVAECCYSDDCNNEGKSNLPTQGGGFLATPAGQAELATSPGILVDDCSDCLAVPFAACDGTPANGGGHFPTSSSFNGPQRKVEPSPDKKMAAMASPPPPPTFLNRRPIFPSIEQHQASLIQSLISNSVRIDFDKMVARMSSSSPSSTTTVSTSSSEKKRQLNFRCRCQDGFLPILAHNGSIDSFPLSACLDPIKQSALVGSRCLLDKHCDHLSNASCMVDPALQEATGIASYMTCQCDAGSQLLGGICSSNTTLPPTLQPPPGNAVFNGSCKSDSDCVPLEHSACNLVSNVCRCNAGYVPLFNNASQLCQCRDPIVLTSTVDGLCYHQQNCRFLSGTDCKVVAGANLTTCQCRVGLSPDRADQVTGLVTRCVSKLDGMYDDDDDENDEGVLGDQEAVDILEEEEEQFLAMDPTDFSAIAIDPILGLRGPHSCIKKATVVERSEWVPEDRYTMAVDPETGTRMVVLYARIPVTATDTDGLLLRLMDAGSLGNRMYSIRILKNREVIVGRSFRDSHGEETETMQASNSSSTVRWLNNKEYTGFWVIYNSGYLSVGVMDESTVASPLLSWTDPDPYKTVDTIGLAALGSAVFYRYQCSFSSAFPDGVCSVDEDCRHLANTQCRPRTLGNATEATFQSCQCKPGFQTIPRVRRTFVGGCYDPIVRTPTLHGLCLDQIHCEDLPNTVCDLNPFQDNERQCVCLEGAEPLTRDPLTGLVPGCGAPVRSSQEPTVETCKRRFEVALGGSWIPHTLLQSDYDASNLMYRTRFFLRFRSEDTVASVKLIEKSSSPRKFYKVTISGGGTIAIYENLRRNAQLFGSRNEERLQVSKTFGTRGLILKKFCGFWITYQPNLGRISVGQTAERFPLVQWTDTSTTRLQDTEQVGFEIEAGSTNMDVGAGCS